eukprot:g35298.t1
MPGAVPQRDSVVKGLTEQGNGWGPAQASGGSSGEKAECRSGSGQRMMPAAVRWQLAVKGGSRGDQACKVATRPGVPSGGPQLHLAMEAFNEHRQALGQC